MNIRDVKGDAAAATVFLIWIMGDGELRNPTPTQSRPGQTIDVSSWCLRPALDVICRHSVKLK